MLHYVKKSLGTPYNLTKFGSELEDL
jgi:hypothetical protein